ncbi:MAG: hypothetical protein HZB85_05750 [Deltaproteobacteria bacterium]|nr:hypothetical protein [Deltaproteobacteria bacterium]
MKRPKDVGFDYYLSKEAIKEYGRKPLVLRLKWLYMGSLLRRSSPAKVVELQEEFRKGRI